MERAVVRAPQSRPDPQLEARHVTNANRREFLIGTAAIATVTMLPVLPVSPPRRMHSRISPKFQAALDELSKQPSTLSPELEAYLERTEGWMDRLGAERVRAVGPVMSQPAS